MRVQLSKLLSGGVPRAKAVMDQIGGLTQAIEDRKASQEVYVERLRQINRS